mgnify:CR=1 FL=1
MPDPSCNPYLALAVMLAAGLDGIRNKIEAGDPVNENIFEMSEREKKRRKIDQLPGNLSEALDCLERALTLVGGCARALAQKAARRKVRSCSGSPARKANSIRVP